MKILLVGGGTFGHVLPALAVAQELKGQNPDVKLLYIGSLKYAERRLVEGAKIRFFGIPAGKWRRYFDLRNISDVLMTVLGGVVSLVTVAIFWPDRVFIVGGHVGLPVGVAAWILRRPIILHESDSVMGLTNRWLSRLASKVCVTFPKDVYGKSDKNFYTGIPINPVFYDKGIGSLDVDIKSSKPVVFVMGGSQGARAVNRLVRGVLPDLLKNYQVVHQAGALDYPVLKQWADSANDLDYHLFDVLPNTKVASLMKRASVIISRSGSAILEVAAVGRPVILIPLPNSANDHQRANANYLVEREAAVMLEQSQATPEQLVTLIDKLTGSDMGRRLAFNIKNLAKPDAATKIAQLINQ